MAESDTLRNDELIPAPPETLAVVAEIERSRTSLFKENFETSSWFSRIAKAESIKGAASARDPFPGLRDHPVDMDMIIQFRSANVHHSTCILTKTNATVGLGFETDAKRKKRLATAAGAMPPSDPVGAFEQSKVDKLLNPLCKRSFADVQTLVAEDFFQQGNGYIEVRRDAPGGKIVGMHWLPARKTFIVVEDAANHHFLVQGEDVGTQRRFAAFGDSEDFILRAQKNGYSLTEAEKAMPSEVIHFAVPSTVDEWYGYPDWLSATSAIELTQCRLQHEYDFYCNRGVPEFMLFIMGQKLSKEDWKTVTQALKANIGLGNSHKSLALNLDNQNITVQLERLAMESGEPADIGQTLDSLGMAIVSAHRVPPLLAGIHVSGKLGAANELPNALMAFQVLVCGPAQRIFQQTFGATLGNADVNGGLGLTIDDFTYNRVTEEIDLSLMNTVGSMRQSVPEAKAQGRDMTAGPKD